MEKEIVSHTEEADVEVVGSQEVVEDNEEVVATTEEATAEVPTAKEANSRRLSDKYAKLMGEGGKARTKLTGLYREWFLDYASYVILERAVPYIEDGLKPVQRRILHSMKRMDDGAFTKVANIIGHTMQFHPPRRRIHRRCALSGDRLYHHLFPPQSFRSVL